MGAAASCVERVGKRRPDGPLLRPTGATTVAASDYAGPQTTNRTPAATYRGSEGSETARGRRRPTVSASVAQAEKLRLKQSKELLSDPDTDEDPDDLQGDQYNAQQAQKQRIQALRESFNQEVKYRSGLFDKTVILDLDKGCQNVEWYTPGSKKRTGFFSIRDIARIQPQKKEALAVDIQEQSNTIHTLVFDDLESRNNFLSILDELKRIQD
eukprot:Protomagalhaensia_sp_Gyna_25__5289@NODE_658_length_2898_cov_6_120322_g514_i0_p2_GENE_NODE_658_length_2898_cov_6_120322_g514_i0NODE_658_length_2898_cov_6_120322_g514_i0_p2_ORF_typecomplete_len212_score34_84DARPP32/PF05395_12/18_NODE_658_length_2898_cov_6_120322_g514_i0155790